MNKTQSTNLMAKEKPQPLSNEEILKMIKDLNCDRREKEIRKLIYDAVGASEYYSWFHRNVRINMAIVGKIFLEASNSFIRDKWEQLFLHKITELGFSIWNSGNDN